MAACALPAGVDKPPMKPCGPCTQVLELPNKTEKVLSFAWEPKGHRFAIVHGDSGRPNVSFYSMRDEKGKLGIKHLGECGCCTHGVTASGWLRQQQHSQLRQLSECHAHNRAGWGYGVLVPWLQQPYPLAAS